MRTHNTKNMTTEKRNIMKTNKSLVSISENIRELTEKSQTLVRIDNVFRFLAICSAAGVLAFAGAYELAENGVDIIGQWYYGD